MKTVAALYVDPRGPYPKMSGVDAWDESRDARKYDGPWPVVAHPPCKNYSLLAHLATTDESDCGPRAVDQVRAFGGVLEHPAYSKLFERCSLPRPGAGLDEWGGFSIQIEQVAWGHVARKKTWLYVVGARVADVMAGVRAGGVVTHWVGGYRSGSKRSPKCTGGGAPAGIKICSAQQRRRTPIAFAEWLVDLAGSVR